MSGRWGCLVWLGALGCAGATVPDAKDPVETDTEPVEDSEVDPGETDEAPGVPVYEPVEPSYELRVNQADGVDVAVAAADAAVGVVLVFHGSGGGIGLMDTIDMIALSNAFVARGLTVVAMESDNRASGQFDDSTAPADNPDWVRLGLVRQQLLDAALITEATPMVAWGFSAGGAFATYVTHAAAEAGWPIRGLIAHSTRARSDRYADPGPLPALFSIGPNDEAVSFDSVEALYNERQAEGREDLWLPLTERALAPTWFARVPYITVAESRRVVLGLVELGYFSDRGERLFEGGSFDAKVDEMVLAVQPRYAPPVTAQLKVLLALHTVSAQHADAEADAALAWVQ
jgi:predicted esterase